jgi:long-chain-fatty-acid--[acyl-carrier-protein] ligase
MSRGENEQEKGVGEPLPGVELRIIDPETQLSIPQGKDGEICIAGPGVFEGYLGTRADPFIFIEGKRWYRSGDRGHISKNGSLVLTGRLKRFVKMGGEMISLSGLEEEISYLAKEKGWSPPSSYEAPGFALCSMEKEGKKTALILYTIYKIDKELLNAQLKNRGHSNLMRIAEVRTLPQIPLTATGKTNYRLLEES